MDSSTPLPGSPQIYIRSTHRYGECLCNNTNNQILTLRVVTAKHAHIRNKTQIQNYDHNTYDTILIVNLYLWIGSDSSVF